MANRFLSHNELATKGHTIKHRPWMIAHTEVFPTKAEAMKREKQLKSANGRKFIWDIIWDIIKTKFRNSDNWNVGFISAI
jgi:putative endonuclease